MARKKLKSLNQWIIPVLALLLIFQATLLVGPRLSLPSGFQQMTKKEFTPQEFPIKFSFSPESIYLKEEKTINVDLVIVPQREIRLDGIDIILSFDPKILEVTQVNPAKLFSFVSQKKEKEREGKIAVMFLEEKSNGLLIKERARLFTLTIKGKGSGSSNLSVLGVDEGPTTVVVESETSRKILFDSASLAVVVY